MGLAASALAACGAPTGNNMPDTGMNRPDAAMMSRPDTRSTRPVQTVENPGEPEPATEDLPADEAAAGGIGEGTDTIGACHITSPMGLDARLCVDYNEGYDAESAGAHCREQGGIFNAMQGCDRSNSRLVSTCSLTADMKSRVVYAYRIPETRSMPNPPTVDADAVTMWCMAQMGTPPAMEPPRNTGRCQYRTSDNFLSINNIEACVAYDQGFSEADAQMDCAGRTTTSGAFAERNCGTPSAANPACRFTEGARTWSVFYRWPYRSTTPWDTGACASDTSRCFQRDCAAAGGTFVTSE